MIEVNLGGDLIKQRGAQPGAGKRGGYRTVIAYRKGARAFFLLGFVTSARANIDDDELAALKRRAAGLLAAADQALDEMIADEDQTEEDCGESTQEKARMRAEIVEITQGLRRAGVVDDAELEKTTIAMLGGDALPKVADLSPAEFVRVREKVGVSQAEMAGFLNVAVSTVNQWERGERRPTGTALKLLHVVKAKGLEALRV